MVLTEEQEQMCDKVYPPFSEKRRKLRKQWNEHNKEIRNYPKCYGLDFYPWPNWIKHHAEMELSPDLPF